ncbi:MAG: hypothetical protein JXB47_12680 [Anaerolineae bacterium]|nr:hypothetical protein [Anaerolineae bacterium]
MNAQGTLVNTNGGKRPTESTMLVVGEPQASNWEIAWLVMLMLIAYPVYYVARASRVVGKEVAYTEKKKLAFLVLMAGAVFVLVFTVSVLVGGLVRSLNATDYMSAIAAPYNLDSRLVASPGSTYGLLPMNVGDFVRDVSTDAQSKVLAKLGVASNGSIASTYTLATGEAASVSAEEMVSENEALFVMRKLREYASKKGSVGNFAIGLGDVSYIYYRVGTVNSLSWTHGPWLYTVSGTSMAIVNQFVQDFPY